MVIAVFGSGTERNPHAYAAGAAIAGLGYDLLTGGGGGAMSSALEGFRSVRSRRGFSHAILPRNQYQPTGYDQVIRTAFDAPKDMGRSPYSRNLVNVAFCHGCVFVSDTPGTLTEVIWMHRLGKPSAFLGPAETWSGVRGELDGAGSYNDILVVNVEADGNLEREANKVVERLAKAVTERILYLD